MMKALVGKSANDEAKIQVKKQYFCRQILVYFASDHSVF